MSINDTLNYNVSVNYSEWFTTIMSILEIIGMWLYFKKAGQAGWKALIPFYSIYIDCTVAKRKDAFIMKLIGVLLIDLSFSLLLAGMILLVADPTSGNMLIAGLVILLIGLVLSYVAGWKISKGLAENFGLETPFAVGLLLLPGIFKLILGVGKYTYKDDTVIDVQTEETQNTEEESKENQDTL